MPPPVTPPDEDLALLSAARWIWAENPNYDLVNGYALFRHRFHLDTVPGAAPLVVTADAAYRLYVNGHYVAGGPARGYQHSWPYDRHDVAALLRPGENILAVRAFNPGRGTFQYRSEGFAGLILALRCGERVVATARRGWRCRRQDGVRRDTVPGSLQLPNQEHIDLRREPDDWTALGFDDTAWPEPITERALFAPPWSTLEPRGIPALDETLEDASAFRVLGAARGPAVADEDRDALADGLAEGLAHVAAPDASTSGAPLVLQAGAGEFDSRLLDLGRPHVGRLEVTAEDCAGDEILDFYYAERLEPDGLTIVTAPAAWNRVSLAGRLVCRTGRNVHAFFHPHGFRYLVVRARRLRGPISVSCALRRHRYPLDVSARLECSDPALEAIYETCVWTQRICAMDALVDTPWREQAQWWGDARIQGVNFARLADDLSLIERGARLIAGQTTPEGITYGTAPGIAHGCVLPDFALTWIMSLWDHYRHTGDPRLFVRHREHVGRILDYFWRNHAASPHGLVTADPRYWLFLDWADVHKQGCPALLNLMLLETLDRVAELGRAAAAPPLAPDLAPWADTLRARLTELIDARGWIREGLDPAGAPVERFALLSQVIALDCGVPGLDETSIIEHGLLPFLRGESHDVVEPSIAFRGRVFSFLASRGHGSAVLAHIRRVWAPMVVSGGTWEMLQDVPGVHSRSHAWSAHPLVHLQEILGGIRPLSPGWADIAFAPCFDGDHAALDFPSPVGPFRANWRRLGDEIEVNLHTPAATRIHVPTREGGTRVLAGGHHRWRVPADQPFAPDSPAATASAPAHP